MYVWAVMCVGMWCVWARGVCVCVCVCVGARGVCVCVGMWCVWARGGCVCVCGGIHTHDAQHLMIGHCHKTQMETET